MANDDRLDVAEAASWWSKHANKVYAVLLILGGLLGGNVDRLPEVFPDITTLQETVNEVDGKVDLLDVRVETLENQWRSHLDSHDELLQVIDNLNQNLAGRQNDKIKVD